MKNMFRYFIYTLTTLFYDTKFIKAVSATLLMLALLSSVTGPYIPFVSYGQDGSGDGDVDDISGDGDVDDISGDGDVDDISGDGDVDDISGDDVDPCEEDPESDGCVNPCEEDPESDDCHSGCAPGTVPNTDDVGPDCIIVEQCSKGQVRDEFGNCVTPSPPTRPPEICDNGTDDDYDELVDREDPDCPPPPKEICDNGTDDDYDELVDREDPDCPSQPPMPSPRPANPENKPECVQGDYYNIRTGDCEPFEPVDIIYCKHNPEHPDCIDDVHTALGGEKIPNQYLVLLKGYIADNHESSLNSLQDLTDKVKSMGVGVLDVYENIIQGFAMKAPNEQVLSQVLTILSTDPRIGVIEQDQTIVAFGDTVPTGIKRVDGGLVNMGIVDESVRADNIDIDIAIIDSGIDLDNPELNVYKHTTFVANTTTGDDDIYCGGHGTHVAGIAAAEDNGVGIAGVAPGARLWALKALEFNPTKGVCEGSVTTLLEAIEYVYDNADKIEIVNLSLGCLCISDELQEAVFQAIDKTVKRNVTFVVAAGNNHMDATPLLMISHPDVIAVSAIADSDGKCGKYGKTSFVTADGKLSHESDDAFASFSNFGDVIDIAAPGTKINSTSISGSYITMSGTSQAAPHVAGAAALFKNYNPNASPAEIRSELIHLGSQSTIECDGNGHGYFTGDVDDDQEPLLYVKNLLQNTTNMALSGLHPDE
jgi:subtilisin